MVMLKILRSKKTAKKIWIGLAVVIIPAFCLWGFGSALRSKGETPFLGRVFGKSISTQEYIKHYRAVRNQYLIQLGEEQLAKLEKHLNLEMEAWDRIILLAEAKRKKITVNNKEVIDSIKQYPFFQNAGKFNPALYREIITYVFRTSPRQFEEEIRDNLTIAKLYYQVTSQIRLSDEEIKHAYEKINEQISLDYISTLPDDFLGEVSVEKQELLDYYNQNTEQFSRPLSYNLEYIKLESKDNQIIKEIGQLLNQGFSLQDAVKNTEWEIQETGFFNTNQPIPQIGWSTEILEILPKLKAKDKAWPQPIQTDANIVYFVGLKEKREPHTPPFEDIQDEVKQKLTHQKASQIAKGKLEACGKEAEISNLAAAAEKFNLEIGQTELFKRQGYVEGLGDSDIFFEAVENLAEDQISQIVTTPSGFYLVKLKQRIRPDEKEFQQEKEEFATNLLAQKREEYFRNFLSELKNRPNTFSKHIAAD
ncbi:MAG: SurA N-terminal domain-containing protein [Candidatus Omnitrophota bacterium]|jgi:hypothetical protein